MRSTRASAAVARLNKRSANPRYTLVVKSNGLLSLRERTADGEQQVSGDLPLDEFVSFVDAMGPRTAPRITRNDAAFARQLGNRPKK